ncbi:MAG TPA: glycosyltransferase family 39 protein, partial [Clostridia bacterium]|nr:glycosyltransferase family 39 protein [Clostridia bacterium]
MGAKAKTESQPSKEHPKDPLEFDRISIWQRHAGKLVLGALLIGFVALHCLLPLETALRIGADEDFELAKATLCLKGHKLYSEVWNDQPPLHTFLITQVLKVFPASALGPRLITTGFSLLLLTAVFLICRRISGLAVATVAAVLLMSSPGFLELSASCMLEIPALAMAVGALCVLVTFSHRGYHVPEIIAGLLFAIALQMKLVPAILGSLAALVLWTVNRERREGGHNLIVSWLMLGLVTGIAFVGIDVLLERGAYLLHFQQSLTSHFGEAKSFEYGSAADHPFEWSVFLRNWDTTLPALVGVGVLIWQFLTTRNSRLNKQSTCASGKFFSVEDSKAGDRGAWSFDLGIVLPLAWLVLSLLVFSIHKPWWPYYYIHTAIPLCWCAAIGIWALFTKVRQAKSHITLALVLLFLLGAFSWAGARVWLQAGDMRRTPKISSTPVLREIARFKPFATYFYAEQPIYSFYAGIPMPPQIAVNPLKRFWAGEMTHARLAQELAKTKPGLILL